MKTTITFKQIDSSDAIKEYITQKIERISRYDLKAMELHVTLTKEHHLQLAELELVAKDFHAHAEGSTEVLYGSIDQAVHKMEKLIQKKKTTKLKKARSATA